VLVSFQKPIQDLAWDSENLRMLTPFVFHVNRIFTKAAISRQLNCLCSIAQLQLTAIYEGHRGFNRVPGADAEMDVRIH
jgi:hypothetical protein